MRSSSKNISEILRKQIYSLFEQTIADIKDTKSAHTFLSDFLKSSEYDMLAKRLAVAYWLNKGRSYENIKQNLQVSSATIASVQQTLDSEGIKLAIKHMEAEEWANKWSEKIKKFVK